MASIAYRGQKPLVVYKIFTSLLSISDKALLLLQVEKCALAVSRKIFVSGRIIAVSFGALRNIPGLLLSVEKENRIKVLIVSEKKQDSNPSENSEPEIVPWSKKLSYPHLKRPEVIIVSYKDVDSISNKTIKIQENDVLKEWRRMDTL